MSKEKHLMKGFMRICSAAEMRELDRVSATEFGIEEVRLMENAGRAAAYAILRHYPKCGTIQEIVILAGKGHNAGDAFVVARHLHSLGKKVVVFHLLDESELKSHTLDNFKILKKLKVKRALLTDAETLSQYFESTRGEVMVIDGLVGTGLKGGLGGIFSDVVEIVNRYAHTVVALDIPTGVDANTGNVAGQAIQAELTLSFGFPKLGHFLAPGAVKRGKLVNIDISLPRQFQDEGTVFLVTKSPMQALLKERDKYGHKNSFGHTLLVGGSAGRLGAIVMASKASHRMGTGLVTVAGWEKYLSEISAKLLDETMTTAIAPSSQLSQFSSVVVGPGLGTTGEAKSIVEFLITKYQGPLVLDADALNLVSEHRLHEHLQARQGPTILTPHPGEMARLLSIPKEEVVNDPVGSLKKAVDLTGAIVLLKGAATLVSSSSELIYLNHYPNDGMATAGSGDVLAGMIAGLLSQKMNPFQATLMGVFLHSLAGEEAARKRGHRSMTASDLIESISDAFKAIKTDEDLEGAPFGQVTLQ